MSQTATKSAADYRALAEECRQKAAAEPHGEARTYYESLRRDYEKLLDAEQLVDAAAHARTSSP